MNKIFNPSRNTLFSLILIVVCIRVFNSYSNSIFSVYSPIGAISLFCGAYFRKSISAIFVTLATIFISDLIINTFVFKSQYGIIQNGWWVTYFMFSIFVLIANKYLFNKVKFGSLIILSLSISIIQWSVSDFMVWLTGGLDLRTMSPLAKDISGLQQSLTQGLPFMKNFFMGTLGYSIFLFGGYELIKSFIPKLNLSKR